MHQPLPDLPFQRKGGITNAAVGRDFELIVQFYFASMGLCVAANVSVPLGVSGLRDHSYDLGCLDQKVLIECKAHTWTETHKVPSAKLTTWDQAMFYFHVTPGNYRKLFCVQRDYCSRRDETLAVYYLRTHGHLVPTDVEIWEFDVSADQIIARCLTQQDLG